MPKLKSHSGSKKRIKITPTGKLLVRRSHRNHFLEKKSASRKRTYSGMQPIEGKNSQNLKKRLGV